MVLHKKAKVFPSPLFLWYKKNHTTLQPWYGFEAPAFFSDPIAEHHATRTTVGLFDVSFHGKIDITGKNALVFLNLVGTRDLTSLQIGQLRLSVLCNTNGQIIDDVTIFHLTENCYRIITNACNRDTVFNWLLVQKKEQKFFEVTIEDKTLEYAKLDIQGPAAVAFLQTLTSRNLESLEYFYFTFSEVVGIPSLISRSGYSGEIGFEIFLPSEKATALWEVFLDRGKKFSLQPVGYQARDSLGLEGGFPIWGIDIDHSNTPLEARYAWLVHFEKEFIGKEKLWQQKVKGIDKKLTGFIVHDTVIPKNNTAIFLQNKKCGHLTSAIFSPTLKKIIALGYLPLHLRRRGQELQARQEHKTLPLTVETLPFYKRSK